jgi:hypothetical protein
MQSANIFCALQTFFNRYKTKIEKDTADGVQVRAVNARAWEEALNKLAGSSATTTTTTTTSSSSSSGSTGNVTGGHTSTLASRPKTGN